MPFSVVGPPAARIVESEVDGNVSLYDPEAEEVLVLNQTASDVWRLCDGSETLDQIVKLLARAYGVEPSEIHGEVVETVKGFRERKLLDEDLRA
jgi:hypothetical protein